MNSGTPFGLIISPKSMCRLKVESLSQFESHVSPVAVPLPSISHHLWHPKANIFLFARFLGSFH
jgi:hypothetical protein